MAASHRRVTRSAGVGTLLASIFLGGCAPDASETSASSTTMGPAGSSTSGPSNLTRIAYQCGEGGKSEICVMRADGTGVQQLTQNADRDDTPAWSPDGRRIVFSSNRDGSEQLYVMDSDGRNQTQLTRRPGERGIPRWSPDGSRIVFSFSDPAGTHIHVMASDGRGEMSLTKTTGVDVDPSWSPDGSQILFTRVGDGHFTLYRMAADGTQVSKLLDDALTASFSPDGATLVLKVVARGISLMSLSDNKVRTLTRERSDEEPTWSPDGREIAFRRGKSGSEAELYVIGKDGTGLRRLTNNATHDALPVWSPK